MTVTGNGLLRRLNLSPRLDRTGQARVFVSVYDANGDIATTFFDVTPLSYAQMGLLPQVHRSEADIYSNIATLLDSSGRTTPPLGNVPNRYLNS